MPPKGAAKAGTKKSAAVTPAAAKKGAAAAKKTAKPTANGDKKTLTAAKKRKAESSESEEEAPKPKKTRTVAKEPVEKKTKATAKKAVSKPAAKSAKAKAAPKTAAVKDEYDLSDEVEEEIEKIERTPKKASATKKETAKKETAKKETAKKETVKKETVKKETVKKETVKKVPAAKASRAIEAGPKINEAPTDRLDVFVFGEGSNGELGLGSRKVNGKKPMDVKRPRLNENLSAADVGVVQIACGGMHAAALTHDNKIYTWGVNDQGALGRDTTWDGGLRDMDAEESDDEDEDDTGMNPKESTPEAVPTESFAPYKPKFTQVIASDSATFALTEDGRVWGWGTFRVGHLLAWLFRANIL